MNENETLLLTAKMDILAELLQSILTQLRNIQTEIYNQGPNA